MTHQIKTCEEILDSLVRDFTSVAPRAKSEVRKRILQAMRTAVESCRPKKKEFAAGQANASGYNNALGDFDINVRQFFREGLTEKTQ